MFHKPVGNRQSRNWAKEGVEEERKTRSRRLVAEELGKLSREQTRHAPRNSNVPFVLPLILILLLVQNFTNSLPDGKMGAYLHASTYVSPTLLLTFLFPRRGP